VADGSAITIIPPLDVLAAEVARLRRSACSAAIAADRSAEPHRTNHRNASARYAATADAYQAVIDELTELRAMATGVRQ
jgi:hypothetical protein